MAQIWLSVPTWVLVAVAVVVLLFGLAIYAVRCFEREYARWEKSLQGLDLSPNCGNLGTPAEQLRRKHERVEGIYRAVFRDLTAFALILVGALILRNLYIHMRAPEVEIVNSPRPTPMALLGRNVATREHPCYRLKFYNTPFTYADCRYYRADGSLLVAMEGI